MKTIWKYELEPGKTQSIWMPGYANILDVQLQGSNPVLWALVDPAIPNEERRFQLVWTGEEMSNLEYSGYIGTFQAGPTVWHLFEEYEDELPF